MKPGIVQKAPKSAGRFLFSVFFVFILFSIFYFLFSKPILAASSSNFQIEILNLCGNNIKETGEQCDGSDLGGASCSSVGFGGGALSCTASCTFNTAACSSGGGGGGGGGYAEPVTSVIFEGRAYPKSKVTLLKDALIAATAVADGDANFQLNLSGLSGGIYIFSVYGEDNKGVRSSLLTFPMSVSSGATTKVGGIFIAPTISTDKSEVTRDDSVAVYGQSVPGGEVAIYINSDENPAKTIKTGTDGAYLYNFDTKVLKTGLNFLKSKATSNGEVSAFSKTISFLVGSEVVLVTPPTKCPVKADLNNDCRVDIVDFSIAAYWYKRPLSPAFALKEKEHLSGDEKIDLVDFSIMAYYWTG
ncbi:MAG: hypothetical protein PHT12_02210 [Patescibacteria group bacterium]|nr:hypothetical protein [Patescibacteria group bacterium]